MLPRSLGLLVFLAAASAEASFPIQTHRLDNGLELVMVPRRGTGLIAYYSMVRVGSRDEVEKGVTGFAHFFEHMMFRGTKEFPPERVSAFLKKTGADQNGFTSDDFTCYTFFGLASDLETLVAMEADRFQNLEYTEDVFKTEAKAVLGEYNKSASSPSLPLRERLREKVFTRHTYGHTTLGYLADIEKMPEQYEYSKQFFKRFYTPDNTVIIAVGDFDAADLKGLVAKRYGAWKGLRHTSKIPKEPPQTAEIRDHVEWPTPTLPLYSVSWRVPPANFASKDTATFVVMFDLLFGQTSRLYQRFVLDEQLVESFGDWSWPHADEYLLHMVARLKTRAAEAKLDAAVDAAIGELANGAVDEAHLEAVKSHVRYGMQLQLVTPDRIAVHLASLMGAGGESDASASILELIRDVNPDDVERFARLYLTKENKSVITLATKEAAK